MSHMQRDMFPLLVFGLPSDNGIATDSTGSAIQGLNALYGTRPRALGTLTSSAQSVVVASLSATADESAIDLAVLSRCLELRMPCASLSHLARNNQTRLRR